MYPCSSSGSFILVLLSWFFYLGSFILVLPWCGFFYLGSFILVLPWCGFYVELLVSWVLAHIWGFHWVMIYNYVGSLWLVIGDRLHVHLKGCVANVACYILSKNIIYTHTHAHLPTHTHVHTHTHTHTYATDIFFHFQYTSNLKLSIYRYSRTLWRKAHIHHPSHRSIQFFPIHYYSIVCFLQMQNKWTRWHLFVYIVMSKFECNPLLLEMVWNQSQID